MKISLFPLIGVALLATLSPAFSAVTYTIGDGLPADGSTTFNVFDGQSQFDVSFSTDRTNIDQLNQISSSRVVDANTGVLLPAGSNGGNSFDPFFVGSRFGGSEEFRTVLTFDLTGFNGNAVGLGVTSLSIFLEVSGDLPGQFQQAGTLGVFAGDQSVSDISSLTSIGSRSSSDFGSNNFYEISLDVTAIDLSADEFTFTLVNTDFTGGATPEIRFGSDFRDGPNTTGTDFSTPAPVLVITADVVPVPEPSVSLLALCATSFVFLRRRRTSES